MYSEYFNISLEAAEIINKSLKAKRDVYAVGASVVRALESSVLTSGAVKPNRGWTDKFIYPHYDFKIATKFNKFSSTRNINSAAFRSFCRERKSLKAYKKAIRDNFRFLAYGDAILIV
jgi:S-adenosylmethionine:tRNA ribosyltransferase-isomerase